MGVGISRSLSVDNNQNNAELTIHGREIVKHVKFVLLGATASGKSTIIKQMKILHLNGFTKKEIQQKKLEIRYMMHEAIYTLITQVRCFKIRYDSLENLQSAEYLRNIGMPSYDEIYKEHIKALWLDSGVQKCFQRSNEFNLIDNAKYFLDKIDKILDVNYIPTNDDILHSYKETVAMDQVEFNIQVPSTKVLQQFLLTDVGGNRDQRKHWVNAFADVHTVLFVVACSEFDQTIAENSQVNRLKESLALFKTAWQNRFLRLSGVIVFLNKQDILEKKISEGKSIGKYFLDYENFEIPHGQRSLHLDPEYNRTRLFIRKKFEEIARIRIETSASDKITIRYQCYYHYTVATNTINIENVLNACQRIILANMMVTHAILE